ncbi:LacI family transcriptional regulator [Mycoplasmopsis mustelae]|uniref:LacI family transcriptional regulator n=1 Tax=Mycoplasmopsis mustelae TaxID=171289 RepID=A0A4R7UDC9_9BACT|nr:LacI family DNA-binding transcriptional regulator [Mycoplasmopsis mustelae]TDV24429.1 LacI family transcriptional regulator [Mycoplasmopsis mustelae]
MFSKKTLSYKDIAKQAKVSISTISRYYNNGYVSQKAKDRILAVVRANEYLPNHGARLIRGRDNSVFIIMPIWAQSLFASIASGITISCSKAGRRVNTTYSGSSTSDYIETIRYALSWRPTAIVIFIPQYDKDLFDHIRKIEDTAVIMYGHQVNGLNWIKPDIQKGFYDLTTKVLNNANPKDRKAVFVSDDRLSDSQIAERMQGYEQACHDNGWKIYDFHLSTKKEYDEILKLHNYLKRNNIKNIICSTHEVYVTLVVNLGSREYNLSDIGYQSVYDNLKNYSAKLFIDYPNIGFKIEDMISVFRETGEFINKIIPLEIVDAKK